MILNSTVDQWIHLRLHYSCARNKKSWLRMGKIQSTVAIFVLGSVASWPGQSHAVGLSTLVTFDGANGATPLAGLTADANGNLFGTTSGGGAHEGGTVFEIAKIAGGYARAPVTLVSFCALANCADGVNPQGVLITDAKGNLFGTTSGGGAHGGSTVFEIVKTAAATPASLGPSSAFARSPIAPMARVWSRV
jgi:uncharacterized repeat protein (TIGR03803 family)